MESVLTRGRDPDGPRSQPPLAAKDDLNSKRAKRGLCPTQPASECAGTLWPARPGPSGHSIAANIDADLQKVGCASRPMRSVGHELAHMGRYRVGVAFAENDMVTMKHAVALIKHLTAVPALFAVK